MWAAISLEGLASTIFVCKRGVLAQVLAAVAALLAPAAVQIAGGNASSREGGFADPLSPQYEVLTDT
jgi:hypothetical protein